MSPAAFETVKAKHSQLRQFAIDLLARREHSRWQLRMKLSRRCRDDALLDRVLDALNADGLQDDRRFADARIRYALERGWGWTKIMHDLQQAGVAQATGEACLTQCDVDWLALAAKALQRRFGTAPPADERGLAQQARFLASRGYTSEQIAKSLKASPDGCGA